MNKCLVGPHNKQDPKELSLTAEKLNREIYFKSISTFRTEMSQLEHILRLAFGQDGGSAKRQIPTT